MPTTAIALAAPVADHAMTGAESQQDWQIELDSRETLKSRGLGLTSGQYVALSAVDPMRPYPGLTTRGTDVLFLGRLIGRLVPTSLPPEALAAAAREAEALAVLVGMTGNYPTLCRHAPGPDPIRTDCGDQVCSESACHTRHLAACTPCAVEAARCADAR